MLKFSVSTHHDMVSQYVVLLSSATGRLGMTDEAVEGKDSFLEKRDPDWSEFYYY